MGHRIDAVVLKGPYDAKFAKVFDLTPISLTGELKLFPLNAYYTGELTLFPLNVYYVDHWEEEFGLTGGPVDFPLLNTQAVLRMVSRVVAQLT